MTVIECKEVTKILRGTKALDHFSCRIEGDKITGLIGRNGAGKTTLLKLIAGYWRETAGSIEVFSERPFNNLLVSANVIFIQNEMDFPTALNLKELLEVMAGFYQNWDRALAERLFEYFSFSPLQHYKGLSKGMKSTFNMIVGLSARAPLTIFDEPTTGMDAAVREDFYRALLKEYLAHPRSIILSSHHLDEIEDLLEDILLIKQGQELLHLPMSDVKEWAVALEGKVSLVHEWIQNREVLYTKSTGFHQYAAVRNDFTEAELQQLRLEGVRISPVKASDLCIYLTRDSEGEIDDVFNKG